MVKVTRNEDGKFDTYAFPGGYPLFYLCADGGVLCPDCANNNNEVYIDSDDKTPEEKEARFNDPQWHIIAVDINYEDTTMYCDHCNKHIVSAYGDDEE
jgi:phage FluMu protein Com